MCLLVCVHVYVCCMYVYIGYWCGWRIYLFILARSTQHVLKGIRTHHMCIYGIHNMLVVNAYGATVTKCHVNGERANGGIQKGKGILNE